MADTAIAITAGTGTNVDTRTEGTNGNHRQVVVLGDPATNAGVAPVDATSGLKVDLGTDNDVTVTGTVTANLSATDNTVLDNIDADTTTIASDTTSIDGKITACNTGAVVISSGTVTANLSATDNTVLDNIDTNTTGLAGTVSGSELQVDVVAALPAGTNAIGKLAANSGVDIGDVDVASIAAGDNNIGNVDIVTLPDAVVDTNHFHATITSADASTATTVKAKTAAKKIYVTSLMISVGGTALEVQLQSDNGTPQVVMEEIFLAANGGLTWTACDPKLPLFIVNTNEDLDVITSASGDITVAVAGYVA